MPWALVVVYWHLSASLHCEDSAGGAGLVAPHVRAGETSDWSIITLVLRRAAVAGVVADICEVI